MRISAAVSLLVVLMPLAAARGWSGPEVLEGEEGSRTVGRLVGDPSRGFVFVEEKTGKQTPVLVGNTLRFPGSAPSGAAGLPPFRVELGLGQRLTGRLGGVSDSEVQLLGLTGESVRTIARAGVLAVVQRPGESQVLQDGFESLEAKRWRVEGRPEVVDESPVAGAKSLRVPAGGSSITHELAEPFGSGRLELAYRDNGAVVADQTCWIDLNYRALSGLERIRIVLGWAEESLAVESAAGPALAVQRLARKNGWHRLSVRFGTDLCEVSVDGDELAHGKGIDGPLVSIQMGTASRKEEPPDALAAQVDDLRLVRFAEPPADLEVDADQDEVRLTAGDQLFGTVPAADAERVTIRAGGRPVVLPWGEVSGLYFRRVSTPGVPIEGLLVRVEWRAAPGNDPRDLNAIEGALVGLGDDTLTLATAYAGELTIPRSQIAVMKVVGRGRRLVLDPMPRHLGDEIQIKPPVIDPPQPGGPVLERSIDFPQPPEGQVFLVLDVVQVVGEAPELEFSNLIKKGELRTNLKFNGEPFDYLNRYIHSKNETPERVRIPVPGNLIHAGKNTIRLEQSGIASDPNYLDDLGVLCIAVETPIGKGR